MSTGCQQHDDVVASVSALSDGGGPFAGAVAPTPDAGAPRCETSEIYVLLSSIVRNQCLVGSTSPSTLFVLGGFFAQNPPTRGPAEMRPVSSCDIDIFMSRLNFLFSNENGAAELCPDHCETARLWVAAEDQRVLECQGFGGG